MGLKDTLQDAGEWLITPPDFGGAADSAGEVLDWAVKPPGKDSNAKVDDLLQKDTKKHLSAILREGGFRGALTDTAKAVAMAESGGDPSIFNGTCCTGLMQVHDVHAGILGSPTDVQKFREWLKDPENNARAAYAVYKKQGWSAWEAFTNGSYRKFLGVGKNDPLITTKKGTFSGTVNDAVDSALGPVDEIAAFLLNPASWARVGKGALGGVFIILGVGAVVFVVANKVSGTPTGRMAMRRGHTTRAARSARSARSAANTAKLAAERAAQKTIEAAP